VAEERSMREPWFDLPQANSSRNFAFSMGTRIDEFHREKGVVFSPPAFGAPELVTM